MHRLLAVFLFISTAIAQVHQETGPVQLKPFTDKSGFFFMPDAMECTFSKSTDGNYKESTCDYQIAYTAKLDGIKIFLQNHSWGDYAYMTIRHPVGDVELARFGTKIMFDSSSQNQDWIETSYDAEIVQGIKIRVHYHTKGQASDIKSIFNFRLHKVMP